MAILKRPMSTVVGLTSVLEGQSTEIGDLDALTTTAKDSLVSAINEVNDKEVSDYDGSDALKINNNLSDLDNVGTARTNLEVMSATEVSAAISAAISNLESGEGNNYNVADIAARDALTNLTTADRVFVEDDGDTKWAIYKPTTVTEGVADGWTKLSDQDSLENALTAPAIKAAYESNENTNPFEDSEKAKLGLISATGAIDLDTVITEEDVVNDISGTVDPDVLPTAQAVKDLVDAIPEGGAVQSVALENVAVSGDIITLANAPVGGVAGILNFATVRFMDSEGASYDAPVAATAEPTEFEIQLDTAGEWNGETVQVQYIYEV